MSHHVKLTKLEFLKNQDWKDALPGGYWTQGVLLAPITVGERITMNRYLRSRREPWEQESVSVLGYFESSPVTEIFGDYVRTENSVWKVEEIAGSPPKIG